MSETPAPEPTLKEALGDARKPEPDKGGAPPKETPPTKETPPKEPPKETPPPADKSDEDIAKELFPNATAEELAEIEASPVLKKVRGSMVKDYKGKTGSLADDRRKLVEDRATYDQEKEDQRQAVILFDALRDDPDGVIRKLAAKRNMTIAAVEKEIKEVQTDQDVIELFGDNADEAQPVFDRAVEKRATAVVDERMKPVIEFMTRDAEAKAQAEIDLALRTFATERKEAGEEITEDIEKKMMDLTNQLDPAPNAPYKDYIYNIYKIAISGKSVEEITKEVTERMERAAKGGEPPEIPPGSGTREDELPDDMGLREALAVTRGRLKKTT